MRAVSAGRRQVDARAVVRIGRAIALPRARPDRNDAGAARGSELRGVDGVVARGNCDDHALREGDVDGVLHRLRTRRQSAQAHVDHARRIGIRRHARDRHAHGPQDARSHVIERSAAGVRARAPGGSRVPVDAGDAGAVVGVRRDQPADEGAMPRARLSRTPGPHSLSLVPSPGSDGSLSRPSPSLAESGLVMKS